MKPVRGKIWLNKVNSYIEPAEREAWLEILQYGVYATVTYEGVDRRFFIPMHNISFIQIDKGEDENLQ